MRTSVKRTRKGEGIKSNSDVLHVCDLEDVNRKIIIRNGREENGGSDRRSGCPCSRRWGKGFWKIAESKDEQRTK